MVTLTISFTSRNSNLNKDMKLKKFKQLKDSTLSEAKYDEGYKAGVKAIEENWSKEETLKHYADLNDAFMKGIHKAWDEKD